MTSHEFKITLSSTRVTCVIDPRGRRRTLEAAPIQRKPHLETITVLEQWLKRWEWILKASDQGPILLVPDTFRVLGDNLWNLALNNDIGREVIEACEQVAKLDEDSRKSILLRISFEPDASDLAALPWEFVRWPGHPPNEGFFLAAETNLVLGRYLEGFGDLAIRTSDLKVRALFVGLLPDKPEFWEQRKEFEEMLRKLSEIGDTLEIEKILGWEPAAVAELLAKLRADGRIVDVVHVVAVCEEAPNGPRLYLPDEGDPRQWHGQDPRPVVRALAGDNTTRPGLVVLHLSDLRGTDPPAHFERLAPSFVTAGIPAVLAMQYPMTHPFGQDFVYNFYRGLTNGKTIGEAVQAARRALSFGRQPNRHFGAPVLYMQSDADSSLVRMRTTAEMPFSVMPDAGSALSELRLRDTASDRPASIAQLLLTDAQLNIRDADTVGELQEWIRSVPWPDDLRTVWLVLQERFRQKQDDRVQANIYSRWMGLVNDMLKEQGTQ